MPGEQSRTRKGTRRRRAPSPADAAADGRDLVWVLTPFGEPAPRVVIAAARAGALGILELGDDLAAARGALAAVTRRTDAPFGVRVTDRCPLDPTDLPDAVGTVVVADPHLVARWRDTDAAARAAGARRVVVEVRSQDEAVAARSAGADGLVAKGSESGGRVGTVGAFLLGQQVLASADVPVWVQGGIGRHTAAAAVAGGATGVVVDSQAALSAEASPSGPVRTALAAMDGSETRVVAGHRVYDRPDLWVAGLGDDTPADELVPRLGSASLDHQAVPVGQEGATASRFAERYGTVGRMVRGLRREIVEHTSAARRVEPLAPGNGIARLTGTRYPVVQGPMTRVSDRSAFAAAVAEADGLPFLALALLPGAEVRPLLEETAERLGDRPWGVGVLGFVPKELRDEQLAVIRDVGPPFALIAGGRPAQALDLENEGIRTFLHVPAPGLLERFLRDGARRFVFEGSECGGHVGPRSSLALWDAQLEVLSDWCAAGGDAAELDVLFAGGIHDERSAAMVAAAAGPLAEAGARIGVVMGTAYLFTEEAVASGAIGEEFQAQALACEQTALLESGPGHATRCADTPFVDRFEQRRRELDEDGVEAQVRWAELEGLNLGRLRLAAKGLRREGDDLVAVDRDEQRREGMFMLGDVATVRRERGTVATLHEAVSAGATAWSAAAAPLRLAVDEPAPVPPPADVAVVGMACVMPGAEDLADFWRNIVTGVNSIVEVPAERWDVDTYFDPEWDHATAHRRRGSASKWGGFIPAVPFDALAYGIPPSSLAAIEPTQLLSLKIAADALADAGYAHRPFDRERTSVIFGAEGGTDQSTAHGFRAMFPAYLGRLPDELDEWLPKISEDSFPGLLTNVIAGRIANRLDLGGKNLTVDAACASSLAALDAACIELVSGDSDMVLAGGADLHNGVQDYLLFTSVHALSTQGQCRTFDASADGITLGEGVACVVLKRLDDALRDGDRVYAVVKSVAAASDGRSLGLTAPRPEGQERSLQRAYARAGVDPRDVGLVEAHGTGTVVGDRTELATLTDVFTGAGATSGSCVVGSVKSNIGHTKCAAGMAGLIKAVKAVYHGVLPPTLHVEQPNEGWDPDHSPFVFLDEARPWRAERRVAGVSAFGFGGTNFHAVVTSPDDDPPERGLEAWPAELFVLRGDPARVERTLADLESRLAEAGPADGHRLRDVAAAVAGGRSGGPVRVAIVADGLDDLRTKVGHARAGRPAPGVHLAGEAASEPGTATGEVAFLFPGQGSQRPGMGGDLFVTFAEARAVLDAGERWVDAMLPPAAFGPEAADARMRAVTDTRVAQPALGLAGLATARVLDRFGVRPDMAAGHSYGELVALCVAGAWDAATLLRLSEARAEAILDAAGDDPGAMVAAATSRAVLAPLIEGLDVVVANDNHPDQLVLAGPTLAVDEVVARLKAAGIAAKRLPVACAFHSPLVSGATEALARHLDQVEVTAPAIPVFANLTAGAYPDDPNGVRELVAGQVGAGVRFTEQVNAMYDAGARVFVEVGPGATLTGCVERILADRPHVAVATDRPGGDGVRSLLDALARLAVAGVPVAADRLFDGRDVDPTRWSRPTGPAGWTVNGHLVRSRDGEVVPGGLRPATTVPPPPALPAGGGVRAANGSNGASGNGRGHGAAARDGGDGPPDQVLVEYFRAAHQIIESGHELLLNYLGVEAAPAGPGPRLAARPAALPTARSAPEQAPAPAPAAGDDVPSARSPAELMGTPDELLARLVGIVSVRTGYPEDVLDPDLDVEADLSIDSIKRLEILSELADQVGLDDDGALTEMEHLVEQLAARKTLRGIVDFLFEHAPGSGGASDAGPPGADADAVPEPVAGAADGTGSDAMPGIPPTANRFVVDLADVPPPAEPGPGLRSARITGDGSLAAALDVELVARGIDVTRAAPTPAGVDGAHMVVLTDLFDGIDLPDLYDRVRSLLLDTACDLLIVAPLGGGLGIDPPPPLPAGANGPGDADGVVPAGAGVRGLVKTAALEFPDRRVRLVDLDPAAAPEQSARALADEILAGDGAVEVALGGGRRRAPVVVPRAEANGRADLPLTGESVVLLTGGARGITGRVAAALAERSGCRLHLVGRSAWPEGDEDPAIAGCPDRMALRAHLAGVGGRRPKEIERECDRILAEREIRGLRAELAAAGAGAVYHQVDVRDAAALAEVVDTVYRDEGRLDGVVHGAGVLDDHLIADKPREAFAQVFSTKVDAARTLLAAVRRATAAGQPAPAFVALFGSIAGVCGNRGQVDYAAANDALDAIAAANQDVASLVFAIDWGPWSPTAGMVSDSLARLFEAGGMGLIDPEDGTAVVLDEHAVAGPGAAVPGRARRAPAAQVIAARCSPELLAAPPAVGNGEAT